MNYLRNIIACNNTLPCSECIEYDETDGTCRLEEERERREIDNSGDFIFPDETLIDELGCAHCAGDEVCPAFCADCLER